MNHMMFATSNRSKLMATVAALLPGKRLVSVNPVRAQRWMVTPPKQRTV